MVEECLLDDEIIEIIIGDRKLNSFVFSYEMPHYTTQEIFKLSDKITGVDQIHAERISNGRKQLMKDLINYCIKNNKISELFNAITDKKRFKSLANNSNPLLGNSQNRYYETINEFHSTINEYLAFSDASLIHEDNIWYVESWSKKSKIKHLDEKVDIKFIQKQMDDINSNINKGNYDTAIGHSKNMIEKVLKTMLKGKNMEFTKTDNINSLLKKVREVYSLDLNKEVNESFKKIISGLINIITGVSEIRNTAGDGHGNLNEEFGFRKFDIQMLANSSQIVSEYFLNIMEKEGGK